jgi:hypothetical protein
MACLEIGARQLYWNDCLLRRQLPDARARGGCAVNDDYCAELRCSRVYRTRVGPLASASSGANS